MKKYLFEEIPLAVPSDRAEMKSVFSKMLDDSSQSVISFINPEIFLAQEKNPLLHEYFRSAKYNFIDGINLLYAINKKLGTSYSAADRYPGTDFLTIFLTTEKWASIFTARESKTLRTQNCA